MHVLFVYVHPEPTSFNATLNELGIAFFESRGHTTEISDLYGQEFDPVEKAEHYCVREATEIFSPLAEQRSAYKFDNLPVDVKQEIERLERADLVVFQFPIWWHSIPAMLKGWMDRVFISGGLYTSKMRYDRGYFRGRRAICSVTTGAPAASFTAGGRGGELEQILWSTHYSLYYMGFDVLLPHATFGVQGHGFSYANEEEFGDQMEKNKSDWMARLNRITNDKPMIFPGWDDWDDAGRLKVAD